jgi:hypothetical protein
LHWYSTFSFTKTSGLAANLGSQFFFMPDSPVSARWLNEREKAIAIKRVTDDQLGVKNSMKPFGSKDMEQSG